MNDDVRAGEVFEIEPADSGGMFAHLPWWLILTVAVVVTELTTHPSVGVTVLCLKFGWSDFRTALWLHRRDPNRRRGAVCSWFYLSSGLWRVFLWSFALMLITIMFLIATEPPQVRAARRLNAGPAPAPEMVTCLVMCLASFAAATMLTVLAIAFAWRGRIKVWISGTVSHSRQLNEWPPRPIAGKQSSSNLFKAWLIGTGAGMFAFLFVAGITLVLSWLKLILVRQAGQNQLTTILVAVVSGVGVLVLLATFRLAVRGQILSRIGADSPMECWPSNESGSEFDSSE